MKKFTSLVMLLCLLSINIQTVFAQEEGATEEATEQIDSAASEEEATETEEAETVVEEADEEEGSGYQAIKQKFIDGGPLFMSLPLLCLILGLAIAIERIISLFYMSINTDKFVAEVDDAISSGNIEGAKDLCRNTRGPVASIFYQGLDRAEHGSIDVVEKAVVNYGSVQMGQLEKGLVWLSLFIALAPMLGFLGTVIGMIEAFDAIKKAGDISPGVVADGISVALLTTVAGLIVAIILQIFYNYIVTKVDSTVNKMEDASISLVDILVKNKVVKA
jgi:biopolymer transport protein ExbB